MSDTPRQRAESLLKIHEGKCSVPHSSPLHHAFFEMAKEKKVTLTSSSTAGYIDVYAVDYKSPYERRKRKSHP